MVRFPKSVANLEATIELQEWSFIFEASYNVNRMIDEDKQGQAKAAYTDTQIKYDDILALASPPIR